MNNTLNGTAAVGRLLIGILFLLSGLSKLGAAAATQGYIASVGLPAPLLAYLGAVVVEVGGSLLLIAGYRVRPVAAVMAVFTLMAAFFFHNNLADQNTMIHFMKNIAITGGLLQVVAYGAGSFSLDARRARREPEGSIQQPRALSA
ncbi:LysR family transcriptional regulator [Kaistia sp. 32K]|uniref:DoxX family protein n=1 Tax=Kaistia sp. 32K TaxID=2795690 RepID=UPI0019168E36|nr:DoxX family protein [Kaistia sp. 32K]BCP53848.1 LysR family transcriptional regulator [Kaistia sp. 32K]